MSTPVLVSFFNSTEALNWNFKPWNSEFHSLFYLTPEFYKIANKHIKPKNVRYEVLNIKTPLTTYDKLRLLKNAEKYFKDENCNFYWIEDSTLYSLLGQHIFYKGYLHNWLLPYSDKLYNFSEITNDSAFFGGTPEGIQKQLDEYENLNDLRNVSMNKQVLEVELHYQNIGKKDLECNLIFTTNIKDRVFHVIGDSHTLFLFSNPKYTGCRSNILVESSDLVNEGPTPWDYYYTHHINNKTMHGISNEQFLHEEFLRDRNVKDNDFLLFVFGEIDNRCHIWKQVEENGRALEEVINVLVQEYISNILKATSTFKGLTLCVFGIIPPLDNSNYQSEEFPIFGSIEQRIHSTQLLNETLEKKCAENGIRFFAVNEHYATEKGDLKWEVSDQFCHISSYFQEYALKKMLATMIK